MDKLWAPWRNKYILMDEIKECIFCQKPKQADDQKNYIICRRKYSFSMLNIFPYNNGHIMAAPYRHIAELEKLKKKELMELMELVSASITDLKKTLNPHGFNVGMNIGKVAGAGFDKHLHMHIVPRWNGDTNFMPVLNQTKIISQSLDELYSILKS